MKRIAVYCGASTGLQASYANMATRLGRILAARNIELVYGGGEVGLMGVLANAVLEEGGRVIGVIPDWLARHEIAHPELSELHLVSSMHERKAMMADLCDAFIAMPGGFGTLDELFEMLTWGQLGLHTKPGALLDVGAYFAKLRGFLDHASAEGFIRREHRELLPVFDDPEILLDSFVSQPLIEVKPWLNRELR